MEYNKEPKGSSSRLFSTPGNVTYKYGISEQNLGKNHDLKIQIIEMNCPRELSTNDLYPNTTIIIEEYQGGEIFLDQYILGREEIQGLISELTAKEINAEHILEKLVLCHCSRTHNGKRWLAKGHMNEVDALIENRTPISDLLKKMDDPSPKQNTSGIVN